MGDCHEQTSCSRHRDRPWQELVSPRRHGRAGHPLFRKKFNRAHLAEFVATAPACIIAMESCPGSQYWGRRFKDAGHTVRIIPAQFVKPGLVPKQYSTGGKSNLGISIRTHQCWTHNETVCGDARPDAQRPTPANKLRAEECALIIATANEVRFASLPPSKIAPRLADEGVYLASESSFYRVLHAAN